MNETDLLQALGEVEFLQGTDRQHLEKIADIAKSVEFPEGKVIFREGEPASHVYLVTSGSVSLEICAPGVGCRRILTVSDGELLGWSPVLGQERLTATARTLSPTQAVQIDSRQLLTLCEHNPRFGYAFMRRAARAPAKRLNATRLQLLNVYGTELPAVDAEHEE